MPWDPRESPMIPDRWRVFKPEGSAFDPYGQNTLKGDRPFYPSRLGREWFVNLSLIPETVFEARNLPVPVTAQLSTNPGDNDQFGEGRSHTGVQVLIPSVSFLKGDTTFKPPDWEIKIVPAITINSTETREQGILNIDPTETPLRRTRTFVGLQEAFVDRHLRNVSVRYDFDSVRLGIQPIQSDFRGFLFQDAPLGVRVFGTRANNTVQYNLSAFRRIEKDTNSGLNDVGQALREDDVFLANVFLQDLIVLGHQTQFSVTYNRNREDGKKYYDRNGFQIRPALLGDNEPHHYDVAYLGWAGDGHFGRFNLTHQVYGAFGRTSHDPFEGKPQEILAGFAAVEPSFDFDWIRVRGSFLAASGDDDPYGGRQTGFDAILENPQIAGGVTSFWIRQAVPFIGGGGVALSGRGGVLPSLRSSRDEGQSNFSNPGLYLAGIGSDLDVVPQLRILANVSYLRFANTSVLEALRTQGPIDPEIGTDVSMGIQYRPFMSQNIVLTSSAAALIPGRGFEQLFDLASEPPYSFVNSLILRY